MSLSLLRTSSACSQAPLPIDLRLHDRPHFVHRVRPLRAFTRSICRDSSQSTTAIRSTTSRYAPVSSSRGTTRITYGDCASLQRALRAFGANQRMQDRFEPRFRSGVAEYEIAHRGAIHAAVGLHVLGSESLLRWRGIASPPGAVSSREITSVSTTVAPSSANMSAARDLPQPMPPSVRRRNHHSVPHSMAMRSPVSPERVRQEDATSTLQKSPDSGCVSASP